MLNNDYNPYDQIQYLTEGMTELAGMIHRQSRQMESLAEHISKQSLYIQDLTKRIQYLEGEPCN